MISLKRGDFTDSGGNLLPLSVFWGENKDEAECPDYKLVVT